MKKIFFDTMGSSYEMEPIREAVLDGGDHHFVRLSINRKEVAKFDIMLVWDMVKEYLVRLAVPGGIDRRAAEALAALREGNDYASRH